MMEYDISEDHHKVAFHILHVYIRKYSNSMPDFCSQQNICMLDALNAMIYICIRVYKFKYFYFNTLNIFPSKYLLKVERPLGYFNLYWSTFS